MKVNRTPELKFVGERGEELAVWEWPGEDPPLLFAHATGFHGRCWDRIVRMFPERHCLALDARGHGRSSQPDLPYHWRIFGRDMAAVAEHWDIRDAIGEVGQNAEELRSSITLPVCPDSGHPAEAVKWTSRESVEAIA